MDKLLKLDFDDALPDANHLKFICDKLDINVIDVQVHRTVKGYHMRILIDNPELCDPEIVLIQCLMGSDKKRECLNYLRVLNNTKHWNVLFKTKEDMNGNFLSGEVLDGNLTELFKKDLINRSLKC